MRSKRFSAKLHFVASQSGQAMLIIVLIMVISLTVGLSVASRSITNLRITSEEENSQRAFSAAEAGIENAIKQACTNPAGCTFLSGAINPQAFDENKAGYSGSVAKLEGTKLLLQGGNQIFKDDGADIWTSTYPDYSDPLDNPSSFIIYWGTPANDCANNMPAALEVTVLSGTRNAPTLDRFAYDPCAATRGNNFSLPQTCTLGSCRIGGKDFAYKTPATFLQGIADILLVRVTPLYASSIIAAETCNACTPLPPQGAVVESVGKSGTTVRKIRYFQGYGSLSSEFFNHSFFFAQ